MNTIPAKKKTGIKLIFISFWVLAAFLTGCGTPADRYAPQMLTPVQISAHSIGTSVQGRSIDCYTFGSSGRTILVIGAIHGSEPASFVLAEALRDYLFKHRHLYADLTILLIPAANPDGLAAGTRYNVNQIDLNRNFPADNRKNTKRFGFEPLSEPESRALYELIENERPARIVSIHQPLNCVDYDGPARSLALRMAALCKLPVKKLGSLPGSLGSWAGETRGIPIITLEMPAADTGLSREEVWKKYGDALVDFIRSP